MITREIQYDNNKILEELKEFLCEERLSSLNEIIEEAINSNPFNEENYIGTWLNLNVFYQMKFWRELNYGLRQTLSVWIYKLINRNYKKFTRDKFIDIIYKKIIDIAIPYQNNAWSDGIDEDQFAMFVENCIIEDFIIPNKRNKKLKIDIDIAHIIDDIAQYMEKDVIPDYLSSALDDYEWYKDLDPNTQILAYNHILDKLSKSLINSLLNKKLYDKLNKEVNKNINIL